MDDQPKCSRDEDEKPQNDQTSSKEQSTVPNTQVLLPKDQPSTSQNQPSQFKIRKKMRDQSTQPVASKDESTTAQIIVTSKKTETSVALPRVHTASTKNKSAFEGEQNMKLAVLTTDQTSSPNNQIVPSMANISGLKSVGNDEAGISFCIARVASNSLSYNSYLNSYPPLIIRSSTQSPIITEPRMSHLPQPTPVALWTQPQSLFLQALSKINENSVTMSVLSHLQLLKSSNVFNFDRQSGDITPPDSLTSAPPSYSFVLRQMAVRRRPRFMGTFFPSPSFVQRTPPPTYTTAFDVYIEPSLPPPPTRVYTFGFTSMPIVCPECGYTGMTVVTSRITICTHLCAFILCLLCCWICAPLPYILRSCKDVYHYCRNCRSFLGMYCPTNPESVYP